MKRSEALVFNSEDIQDLTYPTPFFCFKPAQVKINYELYKQYFPNAQIHYAMKANSEPEILKALARLGCNFEISSSYELHMLEKQGINIEKTLFGNPVKSISEIKTAYEKGVRYFSLDTAEEIDKLSVHAKGSYVYIRAMVDDSQSIFTLSEKFGAQSEDITELLLIAKQKGLKPWGLSFHVGSQATSATTWDQAIARLAPVLENLLREGLKMEVLNIGGGYPRTYQDDVKMPDLSEIAAEVKKALKKLPYQPQLIVEPGRGLVADSMALITSVISNVNRPSGKWLFLDGGTYNALLEAMESQGLTRYTITLETYYSNEPLEQFTLTGPTCDSLDVLAEDVWLPAVVDIGDRLIIHDTGAYSLSLATKFNGFPTPPIYVLD